MIGNAHKSMSLWRVRKDSDSLILVFCKRIRSSLLSALLQIFLRLDATEHRDFPR